jgi:hypothetical protein
LPPLPSTGRPIASHDPDVRTGWWRGDDCTTFSRRIRYTIDRKERTVAVTGFADEIRRVRKLGVGTQDIAVAVGAQPGTVNAWARAARRPTGEKRERFMELISLVDRLEHVMAPRYVPLWLVKPIPALGDRRPLELLSKGRYRDVSKLVAELESDSFS